MSSLTTTVISAAATTFNYVVEFRANGVAIDSRRVEARDSAHALQKALASAAATLGIQGRTLAYESAHVSVRSDLDRR